jgi:hypothetical protein
MKSLFDLHVGGAPCNESLYFEHHRNCLHADLLQQAPAAYCPTQTPHR